MKLTKEEAGYVGANARIRRCSKCVYYRPLSCELVAGAINPLGCCNMFVPEKVGAFPPWLSGDDVNAKLDQQE